MSPGTPLVARGRVTSVSRNLVVAEATLEDAASGKLCAQGSGTFQPSPFALDSVREYAEG